MSPRPRPSRPDPRRQLPAVEIVLGQPPLAGLSGRIARPLLAAAVRAELAEARAGLRRNGDVPPGAAEIAERAALRAEADARPQLRRVLNATGIVIHTNLGRAPLAASAAALLAEVARGYSSLEFDLATGKRGNRG